MTQHFNKLTEGQAERLAMLAEECSEVTQAVTKILRHGYTSHNPLHGDDAESNAHALAREVGNLLEIVNLLIFQGDIDARAVLGGQASKRYNMTKYTHHQALGGFIGA